MIEIGKENTLRILRSSEPGLYLIDEDGNEVLLPNKYVPEEYQKGSEINVFIYKDSEDRLVATTRKPLAMVGDFACLNVLAVNNFGAFLDWGLEKDLMVPFREQLGKMEVGQTHIVYLFVDPRTERIVATSKFEDHIRAVGTELSEGDEVQLLIGPRSDLGIKVIINNGYLGLVYHNEVFKPIRTGDKTTGYVKKIREDGKIDIALERQGYESVEPNAQKILALLNEHGGSLEISDKSPPEVIKERVGMSKKVFKKAIGALYKQRRITISDEGISLNN